MRGEEREFVGGGKRNEQRSSFNLVMPWTGTIETIIKLRGPYKDLGKIQPVVLS